MQYLCDYLGPTMQEVNPAVFNQQMTLARLSLSLLQEIQLTAVIEFPRDAILRELPIPGDRRTGCIFAHTRSVNYNTLGWQLGHDVIVNMRFRVLDVVNVNIGAQCCHHFPGVI